MPMKIFIEKRLLCLLMALCALTAYAQSDDEYKMEIGAGLQWKYFENPTTSSVNRIEKGVKSLYGIGRSGYIWNTKGQF